MTEFVKSYDTEITSLRQQLDEAKIVNPADLNSTIDVLMMDLAMYDYIDGKLKKEILLTTLHNYYNNTSFLSIEEKRVMLFNISYALPTLIDSLYKADKKKFKAPRRQRRFCCCCNC